MPSDSHIPLPDRPLLIPSGPLWSEKHVDQVPPEFVRYWGRRWRVVHHDVFFRRTSLEDADIGEVVRDVYVLERDDGTWLGRLWWRRLVRGWARWQRDIALLNRSDDYPFGGASLCWRCEIGPQGRPWHSGDPQPQDGDWPVSIAVFDPGPGDDTADRRWLLANR